MRSQIQETLSARQTEIAQLVARGQSSREIAAALFLSRRTVENHIAAIYDKLGVGSRAELVSALWRLRIVGGEPPPDAGRAAKTNLLAARTSLVGRETELAVIAGLVESGRLVTVAGAGGVGKTRCALAIGERLLEQLPAGVWVVELASLASGALVTAAVAQTLRLQEPPAGALIDTLVGHVQAKSMLLIFDNCEHLIDEVATLADALLNGCPQLRILATSRQPLRISGEQIYRLPSLNVPTASAALTLCADEAGRYAAITLFAQRAQAPRGGFAVTDANASVVAEICRRLDGIPLAIELAAARANVLTLDALAAKLDARFEVLTSGAATALPRQQTMRALIDWSYDLLAPAEQRFFERLSAFVGGWSLAAAVAIAVPQAAESGVLELLSSLVDKSLVIADVSGCEPRYRLLETTRQYARDKLVARGDATDVARRHAEFYVDAAERFERSIAAASDAEVERAVLDIDNWRAALDWALVLRGDIISGQRIATAIWNVWVDVSIPEGRRWLTLASTLANADTPALLGVRIEAASLSLAGSFGEWEAVVDAGPRLLAACRDLGADAELGLVACWVGESLVCLDRAAAGEPHLREALEIARSLGQWRLAGRALEGIGYARSIAGDLDAARAAFSEALQRHLAIGAASRALGTMLMLAEAEFRAGHVELAVELVARALMRQRELPKLGHMMTLLINFAAYLIACNRFADAREAAREAVMLSQEAQRNVAQAWAIQHLAAVAALSAPGRPAPIRTAARLLGYVDARLTALSSVREYERVRDALRDALGASELAALMSVGAVLTREEAVAAALALDVSPSPS
jgi:predicted ATPase/DNA-binding CsgD family transcriptional regulator